MIECRVRQGVIGHLEEDQTFPGPLGRAGGMAGPVDRSGLGEGVNRANHEPFTPNTTSIAGGRTSVSAPLGICRETTVPMGREPIWIGSAPVRWASIRAQDRKSVV